MFTKPNRSSCPELAEGLSKDGRLGGQQIVETHIILRQAQDEGDRLRMKGFGKHFADTL